MRLFVYTTGGWYDLSLVASMEEISEWERVCSALDFRAAIASGTYNWTGPKAH